MKKKERYNRKNLRGRLSAIMNIYMDGLSDKKRKRLEKYLDGKLKGIVDYYVKLLKKKDKKSRVLPPTIDELTILSKPEYDIGETPGIEAIEKNFLTSEGFKVDGDGINPEESELLENIQAEIYIDEPVSSEPGNFNASKSELPPFSMASDIAV